MSSKTASMSCHFGFINSSSSRRRHFIRIININTANTIKTRDIKKTETNYHPKIQHISSASDIYKLQPEQVPQSTICASNVVKRPILTDCVLLHEHYVTTYCILHVHVHTPPPDINN